MRLINAFVKTQHKNNFYLEKTKAYFYRGSFNSATHLPNYYV